MSSLSTACFVHKKLTKNKNRSPKKAIKHGNSLSVRRDARLKTFATLWENVVNVIESAQSNVYSEILEDCVHYLEKANKQLIKTGNGYGEIPTAVLITGVHMPDHDTVFTTLQEMIRSSISPLVVSLSSTNDADTVKSAIQKVVATLVTDVYVDNVPVQKMKYTMPTLVSWYREISSNLSLGNFIRTYSNIVCCRLLPSLISSKQIQNIPTSPRKTTRLIKNAQNVPSPSKRRKLTKATQSIIIIFEDFERISPKVAEDFILICSEYAKELPIIFIFGVSTSTVVVHKVVSQSSMSKLAMETFQSRRSSDFLNIIVNEVFLNTKFPFKISNRLYKFFEDIFLFNDLSVKTFVNGLKFCLMENFYENALSEFCCGDHELDRKINCLDSATCDEFRKLMSFRAYVNSLPLKEQKALLLDDKYLKAVIRSKLDDLFEYHESFFPILRFLHNISKDLPKNMLGKQLRELYSLCLELDIASSDEFLECSKVLRMMSKDVLLYKVKSALGSVMTYSSQTPNVLVALNDDIQTIINKLEELRGKSFEAIGPQQNQKDIPKARKVPSAFEILREDLIVVIEKYVTKYLRNYRNFVFHEIVYFDVFKAAKGELLGNHRASLQNALEDPGCYLKCNCCESSDHHETTQTWPDVCIAYKLHTEYSRLINLSDWLQSFNALICPSNSEEDASTVCENQELIVRFFHSVAELQFLGFIKPAAQGKTDHVVRYTW